ncbi:MAG: HlyC/CorC family transporter [Parachlamydiaceae bacterium]|nr:HlyC/CorC family transporter [Parachlamydiaceae bacterium]
MDSAFPVILLIVLTLWSGYFSASETALFSLPATRIKAYSTDSNSRRRLISQLLNRPRDLLVTVFMLNTLVNILLQNVASHMFGNTASWMLKVVFPLILTLILGEVIPKSLGLQHNVAISDFVAPLIAKIQALLKPIRQVIIEVTYPVSRIMFFFLHKEENISREELRHVLKTSEELEVLSKDESELVCGYIDLQDVLVKELMCPRQDVLFYDTQEPLEKLTNLFVDQRCTRIPICKGSLEKVIGIMSAKDFFLYRQEMTTTESLSKYLTKIFYAPENMLARVLLRRFDEKKLILAMVVDEYGSIAGLITREDILEVFVGQIKDFRDEKNLYSKQSDNEIICSGKLGIDEFNDLFSSDVLSDNNMVSIGGWISEQLGEIPKSGTKFEINGFFFHVLTATPNRIRRLYVRKLQLNDDPKLKKTQHGL